MRYRHDIIIWRMEKTGRTVEGTRKSSGLPTKTIVRARAGENMTVDTLTVLAADLGLRMNFLFDFELPIEEASRAVQA
jgi:hypothetical protein